MLSFAFLSECSEFLLLMTILLAVTQSYLFGDVATGYCPNDIVVKMVSLMFVLLYMWN